MKLAYLRYFQVVCKHCNLSHAAEELYVSQPTLSYAINDLEKEFGVKLFTRQRNGLTLTPDGEKLRDLSESLLQHADDVLAQMTAQEDSLSPVRLCLPTVVGSLVFPQIFHLMQTHAPKLRMEITDAGSATGLSMVMEGTADAAIVSHSGLLSGSLGSLPLREVPIVLYMSIENPAASLREYDFSTGPDLPLVLLKKDSFISSYVIRQFKKQNRDPNVLLHTSNLHAIRNMLDKNSAATFLYEGALSSLEENIVTIPLRDQASIQISLVWNRKQKPTGSLANMLRILKAYPLDEAEEE